MVLSCVGGTCGMVTGALSGAAVGIVPALLTFGLSIPCGAIAGGTRVTQNKRIMHCIQLSVYNVGVLRLSHTIRTIQCMRACPSVCPSVGPFVRQFVCPSVRRLSVSVFVCLSVRPSVWLSAFMSVCLSMFVCV